MPAEDCIVVEEDVSASWRSSGLVNDVYWPGKRWIGYGDTEDDESNPPTVIDYQYKQVQSEDIKRDTRVTLEYPCIHCPGTHKIIVSGTDWAAKKSVYYTKRITGNLPAKVDKAINNDSRKTSAIRSQEHRKRQERERLQSTYCSIVSRMTSRGG